MMGAKMKSPKRQNILKNEQGLALLETVPLLVIFMMLVSFALGLFGYIHSGILYSISARTYAFETFRNRTNLTYFRENNSGLTEPLHFSKKGIRFHAITGPNDNRTQFVASSYPIKIGNTPENKGNADAHNNKIFDLKTRNQNVEVSPAWLMVGYGLCVNYNCGDRK